MMNDLAAHPFFTHVWKSRTTHPERNGQLCRIIASTQRIIVVQFPDGARLEGRAQCLRKRPLGKDPCQE
jgi:hypothetical protein